jgi:diguanylate cyclase (GGDEF)-like protein
MLAIGHEYAGPFGFTWIAAVTAIGGGMMLVRQALVLRENKELFGRLHEALGRERLQAEELQAKNLALQAEVAERKHMEEECAYNATHDSLTGLPNRALFFDRLRQAIQLARCNPGYGYCLLFFDLDRFKVINDSLGHSVGDDLLVAIARRMRENMRSIDTLSRLSGDEFAILLEDVRDAESGMACAARLQEQLSAPFLIGGRQVYLTASIGVVVDDNSWGPYETPEELLRDADIAMYHAKTRGRACYAMFNTDLRQRAIARLELEDDLRHALERGELELYYQPIISMPRKQLLGFEALLRWGHPLRGLIPPLEFIPMAEETGLINPIGGWVLREACRQLKRWQAQFYSQPPLTMNVNISGAQLHQSDFTNQVQQALIDTGLDGSYLKLEITENVCLQCSEAEMAVFHRLNRLGVQFQLDDFGTGYSSLAYLQNFPINTIKIDRSFVQRMSARKNSEIVRTIVAFAHDLGMSAVAEGVETEEQLGALGEMGCNYSQGFLISPPVCSAEASLLLKKWSEEEPISFPERLFARPVTRPLNLTSHTLPGD